MVIGLIIAAAVVYCVLHIGHRRARRRGERGMTVYWNSRSRRPYVASRCAADSASGTGSRPRITAPRSPAQGTQGALGCASILW